MTLLVSLLALVQGSAADVAGAWRARLVIDESGRELPFGLELAPGPDGLAAEIVNEPERIPIPEARFADGRLVLAMPHYDSAIEARLVDGRLEGMWEKTRAKGLRARVPFRAERGPAVPAAAAASGAPAVAGRWAVRFESDASPAVGVFEAGPGAGRVRGTFLTATGDYRYLAGTLAGTTLRLSCFDGAHAFLFEAELADGGRLAGTFWSGNWWTERWSAERDPRARLADPFRETHWNGDVSLASLAFPDLDGRLRSLAGPELAGLGTLLVIFGSWCPNCNDEAQLLVELDRRYRERGLSIVGLAFELTGEFARDREQVARFAARHGVRFPLLLAGTADKRAATLAFGGLEAVKAFPTTIFLGGDGRVRAVHSGYAGPATGREHAELRARFELLIEELLATPVASAEPVWEGLLGGPWTSSALRVAFRPGPGGREALVRAGPDEVGTAEPVALVGDAVWVGKRVWRFDRAAGVLLDPLRAGERLAPEDGGPTPLLARLGMALVALAAARAARPCAGFPEALALLDDPDQDVERTAIWALGHAREPGAKTRLVELLAHPNLGLRREAVLALLALAPDDPHVARALAGVEASDPDPLVREALRARASAPPAGDGGRGH
jgi:thiol-disulfide isomerase/thioredoxin